MTGIVAAATPWRTSRCKVKSAIVRRVRSLQALSGRVILLLVLKHLSPERDHFGIEPSASVAI